MSYPHLWTVSQTYYFMDWYIDLTASWDESGIGKLMRQRYVVFEQLNAMNVVTKSGNYNLSINNFFTYVTERVSRSRMIDYEVSRFARDEYFVVELSQSVVIFLLHSLLLVVCLLVFVLEIAKSIIVLYV